MIVQRLEKESDDGTQVPPRKEGNALSKADRETASFEECDKRIPFAPRSGAVRCALNGETCNRAS